MVVTKTECGWGVITQCQEFLKPKQLSSKNDKHHKMPLPHLPPTSSVGTMSQQSSLAEQPGTALCRGHSGQ